MGLSIPSTTCDRTAPSATSEASVSRMHGSPGTGNARVVASRRACFRQQKGRSASSVHLKIVFLLVRRVRCSAIDAKLRTSLR